MGGLGSGGGKAYPAGNHQALEELFKTITVIGRAYENGRVSEQAFKAMSQVFKELGSNPSKAKGASETIMYIQKQLDEGAIIVNVEARVAGQLKGGAREYDVVITKAGKTENIEIKAWDPAPKDVYNPAYLGNMLFFSLRGKTNNQLKDKDLAELKASGLPAEELQAIVNESGQLFEDLGQSLRKVVDDKGNIDANKLSTIEHFWVFDGRLTSDKKTDMINQFMAKIKGDKALFEVFKREALKGNKEDVIDKFAPKDLQILLEAMIKTNI